MNTTEAAPAPARIAKSRAVFFALAWSATAALAGLAIFLPPDGHERAPLAQFAGRFHPLLIHVPIALILLVPVLELLGANPRRAFLRQAAALVLVLATIAILVSAALGWVLAFSGGFAGELVAQHLKGGVVLAAAGLLALACRARWSATGAAAWRWSYALVLAFSLVTMTWAAHVGGQITHGETYLTDRMPQPFRAWFVGAEKTKLAPPQGSSTAQAVFTTHIQPIFDRHCVNCHGAKKIKGGLRLDSFAELMKGGDDVEGRSDGQVVVAGNPLASDLYRRITLPADDESAMPPDGKNPLTAHQIRLLEWWIVEGASATTTPATATYLPPDIRAILAEQPVATNP